MPWQAWVVIVWLTLNALGRVYKIVEKDATADDDAATAVGIIIVAAFLIYCVWAVAT